MCVYASLNCALSRYMSTTLSSLFVIPNHLIFMISLSLILPLAHFVLLINICSLFLPSNPHRPVDLFFLLLLPYGTLFRLLFAPLLLLILSMLVSRPIFFLPNFLFFLRCYFDYWLAP